MAFWSFIKETAQYKKKKIAKTPSHPSEISVAKMSTQEGCIFSFQHSSQFFVPPCDPYFQARSRSALLWKIKRNGGSLLRRNERKGGGMHVPCHSNHLQWLLQLFKCSLSHLIINYQAVKPQKLSFPTLAACIKKRERKLQESSARVQCQSPSIIAVKIEAINLVETIGSLTFPHFSNE